MVCVERRSERVFVVVEEVWRMTAAIIAATNHSLAPGLWEQKPTMQGWTCSSVRGMRQGLLRRAGGNWLGPQALGIGSRTSTALVGRWVPLATQDLEFHATIGVVVAC